MRITKRVVLGIACLLASAVAGQAMATQITYTNLGGDELRQVDTVTHTNTLVASVPLGTGPDSLIFDTAGNIVYTGVFGGNLNVYNTTTHTNSVILSGMATPQDLTLTPDGASVLVSDSGHSSILKVNLTTHAVSTLRSGLSGPTGIAFDGAGDLFVNDGGMILQLNPLTGATMNSIAIGGADGLCWDSFSGKLWAAQGTSVVSVDTGLSGSVVHPGASSSNSIDGLMGDGLGHIFLAEFGSGIGRFNISLDANDGFEAAAGIDDLAPITGLGSSSVPLPASVWSGLALLGVAGLRRLKRRTVA